VKRAAIAANPRIHRQRRTADIAGLGARYPRKGLSLTPLRAENTSEMREQGAKVSVDISLPIERHTLSEQVAKRLRDMIAENMLKPGEKLNDRVLAQTLQVSRTPLRDAFKLLAGDGLIDLVPYYGAFVANPNPREAEDLLTALRVIEAAAGELACLTASDEAIAAIRNMHDRVLKAFRRRDPIECFKLEEQIHLSIAKACRNTILQRLHHTLNTRLYRARFISTSGALWDQEQWAITVSNLDAIIAALERRDAATLSSVLKKHLGITWKQTQPAAKAVLARMQKRRGA
jgi:DNA-binding GntR family transcriptional regulator